MRGEHHEHRHEHHHHGCPPHAALGAELALLLRDVLEEQKAQTRLLRKIAEDVSEILKVVEPKIPTTQVASFGPITPE